MAGADTDGELRGVAPSSSAIGLYEQAAMVGAYRWTEQRCFELLGGWVGDEPLSAARVLFDVHSQQHAWHAQLFAERLPVLDGLDTEALTVPPANVDAAMTLAESAGETVERLAASARFVLPRLVAAYTLHLRRAAPVAEAPLVRVLRLVVRDEIEAWQATETLLEDRLAGPEEVGRVADRVRTLEELVAGSGPGLVPWPTPGGS